MGISLAFSVEFGGGQTRLVRTYTEVNGELEEDELHMSNSNADAVMSALGVVDFDAMFAPQELIRLCDLYLTSEIASFVDGGKEEKRSSNWIECARRQGYITEKVKLAKELSRKALALGAQFAYFV